MERKTINRVALTVLAVSALALAYTLGGVASSKTEDPKSEGVDTVATPTAKDEPRQGLCCFVDASLEATASNADDCMPEYTGEACAAWEKWKNFEQEEYHARGLANWEYRETRWPRPRSGLPGTYPWDEPPTLKRYHILLVPSVWVFTYKCSYWTADDGGPYVGKGFHHWSATQTACQKARVKYESNKCLAQSPCVETSDVGERSSDPGKIVDIKKHESEMAKIHADAETKMRSARWHRCRDRADGDMEGNLKLNCKYNAAKHLYRCRSDFLMHEKDLKQRAYDACDRACPTCQGD